MIKFINRLDPIIPSMLGAFGYFLWDSQCYLAAAIVMFIIIGLWAIQVYTIGWYVVDIIRMLRGDRRSENSLS